MTRVTKWTAVLAAVGVGALAATALRPRPVPAVRLAPLPDLPSTSAANLDAFAVAARARVTSDPTDAVAAVRLSDVLLRKARVERNGGFAFEAERVLKALLQEEPSEYSALKMLGPVYMSQHRYREAIDIANRAIGVHAEDAWNYGVLGDARLELGEYDRAFDAFDKMVKLRPDAASYARVAYALELQGRLPDALRQMRMAAEATSAHDSESQAWHYAQIANILFQMGEVDDAAREYARANFVFPGHPYARAGLARVAAARGDRAQALDLYRELLRDAPTAEVAASLGDLMALDGDAVGSEAMYKRAEAIEREAWLTEAPQPGMLARMLAERGLKTAEAVRLAELAMQTRQDIYTYDAAAWAYFRAGRLDKARRAAQRSRRLGTADRTILYHGAAIEAASGDHDEARRLLTRALAGHPASDVLTAPRFHALARQLDVPGAGIEPARPVRGPIF